MHNLFEPNALFETSPMSDCFSVRGYVQLFKCLISERSIVFDSQIFWVSTIKFDYRTQSNSIERAIGVRLGSINFAWITLFTG